MLEAIAMLPELMDLGESVARCTYFWVRADDGDVELEVRLDPHKSPGCWGLRVRTPDARWEWFTREDMARELVRLTIAVDEFAEGLLRSILNEAVYADMVLKRVSNVVGDRAIDAAISAHEQFAEELNGCISKLLMRGRVIEGEGKGEGLPSSSAPRAHLRLVHSA